MKKSSRLQWFRFLGGLLAVWVLVELVFFITPRIAQRDPGSLAEAVYVWQRVWSPEVKEAVTSLPEGIKMIFPLAAEVRFPSAGETSEATPVHWGYETVREAGVGVGLVIRIGDSGARTGWEPWACEEIISLAASLLEEARSEGIAIEELQIDYDCPASRLTEYRKLLLSLKEDERFTNYRISFTSLPSWLSSHFEEMKTLAEVSDSFVLQVHALDLPKTSGDPVVVMDPNLAETAIRRAAEFGVPFSVALPTYSSFVVFDESESKVVDVLSEDLDFSKLTSDQRLILGEPPMAEISRLVSAWKDGRRVRRFEGIVWYRLPVEGDILNWPLETWNIVRRGEIPRRNLEIEFRLEKEGFDRISLRNGGQYPDSQFPETITIQLDGPGALVRADGGRWYSTEGVTGGRVTYTLSTRKHDFVPLPIGRELPIGWVRKTGPGEYSVEFSD